MPALLACTAMLLLSDAKLDEICQDTAAAAIAKFPALKPEQFAVSVAVVDRASMPLATGSARGSQGFYPASVVKLFYLGYSQYLLEHGKLKDSDEFERARHDMIVDSVNDATGLVLETVTGTTGGPELPPTQLAEWMKKRQAVNRWYLGMGYIGVNACQKTWNEGPYGRERQGYGPKYELRNQLTTDACVRLMSEIATRKLKGVTKPGSYEAMEKLLHRAIPADSKDADEQAKFTGSVLPSGSQLWSKAGWTSEVRHDVAWVKLPNGHEYVWAIFTKDHANDNDILPGIASVLLQRLEAGQHEN